MSRRPHPAVLLALMVYLALCVGTVRSVGRVGEVALGWTPGPPPAVAVSAAPLRWSDGARAPTAGHRAGPLVASQTRPTERLQLGDHALPLAINSYTGGLPDWPARLATALTGHPAAALGVHVGLGALLIAALAGRLRRHGAPVAAGGAALVLASHWSFVFYRKVLGGTELALLAGMLLILDGLLRGGRRGGARAILGLGIGIGAKLPFVLGALPLVAAGLILRPWRDRTDGARADGPPADEAAWRTLGVATAAAALLVAPLAVAALHHRLGVPALPHVRSHDFPEVQWRRVLGVFSGGSGPAREQAGNILRWAVAPTSFFRLAYGATAPAPASALLGTGWALAGAGTALAWLRPWTTDGPLRFVSLALVGQVALLGIVARDLHHLAQATPLLAATHGLAAALLARRLHGRWPRLPLGPAAAVLLLPTVLGGALQLARTDRVVETVPVATFPAAGQRALAALVREAGVRRVVVCDYEAYGMLGPALPGVEVVHLWGLASRRFTEDDVMDAFLTTVLRESEGGGLLLLRASAPMIYNLRASDRQLDRAAASAGLQIEKAAELPASDGGEPAARLFLVRAP